ncbi:MAG: hypothetical protein Q8S20_01735 [Sulfuritalea sp.]|nr:hypothetical protein [Sulfuritalea sp.]
MADGPELVELTAYFPKRVLCFGRWQEGHMRDGRGCRKDDVHQSLTFAKTVQDAGGLFYLDGRKFKHVEVWPGTPRAYSIVLRDGYVGPICAASATAAAWTGIIKPFGCMDAEGAAGDPATMHSQAQKLYVLVTRKVSPEIGTRTRKVSLTGETRPGKLAA